MKNNIRKLRKSRGLNQKELAQMLNVAQGTLSYWEQGKYDVDNTSLQRLSEIFGVSIDYILLGKADAPSPAAQKEPPMNREAQIIHDAIKSMGIDPFTLSEEHWQRIIKHLENNMEFILPDKYMKEDKNGD